MADKADKLYFERDGVVHEVDPSERLRIDLLKDQGFTETDRPEDLDTQAGTNRPYRRPGTGKRRGPLVRDGLAEDDARQQAAADLRTNPPEDDQHVDEDQVAALVSGDLAAEQEAIQAAMSSRAEGSSGTSGGAYNQMITREDAGLEPRPASTSRRKKADTAVAAPGSREVPPADPANASNGDAT